MAWHVASRSKTMWDKGFEQKKHLDLYRGWKSPSVTILIAFVEYHVCKRLGYLVNIFCQHTERRTDTEREGIALPVLHMC